MNNIRKNDSSNEKIYTLLLQLKEEVTRLTLQVKGLGAQVKGVKNNG